MSEIGRKPLDPRAVKDETDRAMSDRLREIMMKRARQTPPASTGVGDDGTFQYAPAEDTFNAGSDQTVYVNEYVRGTSEPADMDALNQDWGDAGSRATGGGYPASNPDASRDHTLDGTVRHEPPGYVARDAGGSDEPVPEEAVPSYMQDMTQGPAYEPGDNETREFLARRLREEANKNEPTAIARRP
jgi:hypothetical protein